MCILSIIVCTYIILCQLILGEFYDKILISMEVKMRMPVYQNLLYLLGGAVLLGISFFFLMRSANKNLEALKSKSKKRR